MHYKELKYFLAEFYEITSRLIKNDKITENYLPSLEIYPKDPHSKYSSDGWFKLSRYLNYFEKYILKPIFILLYRIY